MKLPGGGRRMAKVRLDQCQGNPTFGRGWAARIADIRRQALLMAAG